MPRIDALPAPLRDLARRIDSDRRVGVRPNGAISPDELQRAERLGLIRPQDRATFEQLRAHVAGRPALDPGGRPVATPGTFSPWPSQPSQPTRPTQPAQPGRPVATPGVPEHRLGTDGMSDTYTLVVGKNGIKPGAELVLPIPPERQGFEIQNIDVSFHAPVRQWNAATRREEKPTYATFSTDDRQLMRKFVDPNADAGNIPEIDNVHPENATDTGSLGPVGRTVRIRAQNDHVDAGEDAMTVQWVRVNYKPRNVETKTFSFRGRALPNQEWEGRWVRQGQPFTIDIDPTRKVSRVEVQWSDKPDDVGYDAPGRWARGTVTLDGQTLGNPGEHVGSPEWQSFEGRGVKGGKLQISAADSDLKVFEVRVLYER
ncbi:MAG: hypothetical protein INH41_10660 [Myxococcaceae bacterium]|jgi:hypothetical protein|nr:hypothetical protein [Myxococcaceae bacterium]MCA3012846.1 hypothetical protein [Myxococcaceae bacterium]